LQEPAERREKGLAWDGVQWSGVGKQGEEMADRPRGMERVAHYGERNTRTQSVKVVVDSAPVDSGRIAAQGVAGHALAHARVDARQCFDPADIDRHERLRQLRESQKGQDDSLQREGSSVRTMRRAQSMTIVELEASPRNARGSATGASAAQKRIVASGSEKSGAAAGRNSQVRHPRSPAPAHGGQRVRSMSTAPIKSRASLKSISSVGSLSETDGVQSPKKTFGCDDFEHANGTEDFHVVSVEWVRETPKGRRAARRRAEWVHSMQTWRSRFGIPAAGPAAPAASGTPAALSVTSAAASVSFAALKSTSPATRIAASNSRKAL